MDSEGVCQLKKFGCHPMIWPIFFRKLQMKNEKKWTRETSLILVNLSVLDLNCFPLKKKPHQIVLCIRFELFSTEKKPHQIPTAGTRSNSASGGTSRTDYATRIRVRVVWPAKKCS